MVKLQTICVPIDFSENSVKAAQYGLELARDRKARLYFLHILNQRIIDAIRDMSARGYKGDFIETVKQVVRTREADLSGFVPEAQREGLDVQFEIRKGKPAEEIIGFCKEKEVDLIIAGTKGRSALQLALVGSVARNLVNHAPCPVLIVRPLERDFVD